ncbi:expressed unknown protein [Seminavis robusta]|uniref:Uncharacterized protein n=1 Tax=Seminavis robusta TaxID=568900 RepID=A0A9N8DMN7_9STRA|nr:expressed unknown protein [Seminavis robusta]|eukprot:Sro140_g065390.1 n/a (250) ;mRNA; r:29730-30479
MLASLVAMLCLLLELLQYPFQRHQKTLDDCADVSDLDDSVCSEGSSVRSECSSCGDSAIATELSRAFLKNRRLILTNFVARSTSKDVLELCELLEQYHQNSQKLRSITFRDIVHGANYRRWLFKKTSLYRRVLHVADQLNIEVQFEATVEICTECMSPKAMISLLDALKADADVKSVVLSGSLYFRDAMCVVGALRNLLANDHRHWQTVSLSGLHFAASRPMDAKMARKSCYRTLQKIAAQRYISVQMQ